MTHPQGEAGPVLVVVEGNAASLYWMDHFGPLPSEGAAMLEQEVAEPLGSFRNRLGVTLERRAYAAGSHDTVVFVAGARCQDIAARWELATALLVYLVRLGAGQLVLTHGYGPKAEVAGDLSALAEDLEEAWRGSGPTIIVRVAGEEEIVFGPKIPVSARVEKTDLRSPVRADLLEESAA